MRESRRRRSLAVAAIVGAALCLLAPPAARATTWVVTATGNDMDTARFTPRVLTIQVGDTVSWVNHDGIHNVVADDGSFVSGSVAPPEAPVWPFNFTFTTSGAFRYYCSIHGNLGGVGQSGIIVVRPPRPSSDIVYEIPAWEFQGREGVDTFGQGGVDLYRWITSGYTQIIAPVHLPSGVQITGIELVGCDDSAADDLGISLHECPDPLGGCGIVVNVTTSGQPGCGFFDADLANGPNINNLASTYVVTAQIGNGNQLRFRNVRIFYKRVISPAPLTATFADVPTNNQFFKVIEALAASGITQGCGNGNFCPNDPVTRGSMASFLARALGLFFPN